MELQLWVIYLLAAIGLSVSPGPNGLLALTHGALYGHRRTLITIIGGVSGFVLVIGLSMFGIGAILQTTSEAIVILKWLGGGYLVWLGVQLWRSPPIQLTSSGDHSARSNASMFRQGLIAAISNPKALLFFGAFLSQFIDPAKPLLPQFLIMTLTFAATEFMVEYILARTAHQLRPWLQRSGKTFNRTCGGIFAAVGAYLPLAR